MRQTTNLTRVMQMEGKISQAKFEGTMGPEEKTWRTMLAADGKRQGRNSSINLPHLGTTARPQLTSLMYCRTSRFCKLGSQHSLCGMHTNSISTAINCSRPATRRPSNSTDRTITHPPVPARSKSDSRARTSPSPPPIHKPHGATSPGPYPYQTPRNYPRASSDPSPDPGSATTCCGPTR